MNKRLNLYRKIIVFNLILSFFLCCFFHHSKADEVHPPEIYSPSAIMVDGATGQVLYEKNSRERMYPASTTKLMTAMIVLESCGLDDKVTITEEAVSSVPETYMTADLQVGEVFTVDELLQILLIPSANDVANALACHVSGSIDAFADLMNNRAISLGANDTHFTNPSGVHDENHYSTAYDMCIIGQYANSFSRIREISMQKECQLPDLPDGKERKFTSTNTLMMEDRDTYYEYATGLKTGYTDPAKSCIVAKATKDDRDLICVVLGGDKTENNTNGRDEDCITLFEYGFNNFEYKVFCEKDSLIDTKNLDQLPEILKDKKIAYKDDIKLYVNTAVAPDFSITWKDDLQYPILRQQVVGTITYTIGDNLYSSDLYSVDFILPQQVERAVSYVYYILIGLLVIFIGLIVVECVLIKKHRNKNSESDKKES